MNPVKKISHYWSRSRLMLNSDYYPTYLRKQGVSIGKDSVVLYPSYIDGRLPYLLEIGNNVVISLYVTILTHDATSAYAGDLIKVGPVRIHDHTFIGANTTILCNVSIGPNSIVGAGSVVSKDIPPDTVYAGNPARLVCNMEDFIEKHRARGIRLPIMEGRHYEHPYIPEAMKALLKENLKETFGYFCARLPESGGPQEDPTEPPAEANDV